MKSIHCGPIFGSPPSHQLCRGEFYLTAQQQASNHPVQCDCDCGHINKQEASKNYKKKNRIESTH